MLHRKHNAHDTENSGWKKSKVFVHSNHIVQLKINFPFQFQYINTILWTASLMTLLASSNDTNSWIQFLLESLKQNKNILLVLLAKLNLRPYLITTIIQKQKKCSSNCTVNDRHTATSYNSYSNRKNLPCFYPTWSISCNFTHYWYIRFTVISIFGDL